MGVGNAKSLGGGFARIFLALIAPVTVTGTASDKSESINFDFFFLRRSDSSASEGAGDRVSNGSIGRYRSASKPM